VKRSAALALALAVLAWPASGELRGHGGPVRALAVTGDGTTAISGSFDTSAIVWSLALGRAVSVLRGHEGAVNAVAAVPDGRFASAGADGRVLLWRLGRPDPETVLAGHEGPVAALAASPDGQWLASASWDRTIRLWPLAGGEPRVLRGHQDNVNGVAFLPDGRLVSAGYDATLRFWPAGGGEPVTVTLPAPQNVVATTGSLVVSGGADGRLNVLSDTGALLRESEALDSPVTSLAISPDASLVAAAGLRGAILLVDLATARTRMTLVGPGLPVWSMAFLPDGRLLTGGADRVIRLWDTRTGEHLGEVVPRSEADDLAAWQGDPGAEVFRACAACHSLTADGGNRAGPTLHGLFGRRIATAPGYAYSPALKAMDIVWTPQAVRKLFELGPSTYTPGTKMPEQTVSRGDDLDALIAFLEKATR
jgi:cytochrome c